MHGQLNIKPQQNTLSVHDFRTRLIAPGSLPCHKFLGSICCCC